MISTSACCGDSRRITGSGPSASTSACFSCNSPDASGRIRVRSTCGSKSRSATSFITQPAARINTTPQLNINMFFRVGVPAPASKRAHQVGHSSNRIPMGLSKRIRRQYAFH